MDTPTKAVCTAASSVALLLSATAAALPAHAAPPPPVVYDALGDSYAVGAGVLPADTCGRSASAPAVLVDGRMRIALDDLAACGGATTADTYAQVAAALDADTDLVTISMGGNDVAWTQAVGACVFGSGQQCVDAVAWTGYLSTRALPPQLDAAYAAIRQAAPDAHVVVTGYPRFFSAGYGDWTVAPGYAVTTGEQALMNAGADTLNAAIAQVAARHGFQFVDVTKRFADHGVNAADPWISDLSGVAPFHPTARGYEAYAAAITSALNPRMFR